MRLALSPHPDTPPASGLAIEVEVERRASTLELRYLVTGAIDDIRLPAPAAEGRADELWKHTCFEAFIGRADGGYYEFNFAPSTRWAAYGFSGYREGMADADVDAPVIQAHADEGRYEVRVSLQLDRLPGLPADQVWTLALTAVIEDTDGAKSYWALRHAPGRPDFHHRDGFACELTA
ncbi:DOMON-like domain-containing protein [Caulobacter sp. 17J80-11]|uniref:DOMON-like domain-containing protein n=1 Tax=Caulobacter sp. 17J80-11 TaxID=2763502 RepID=UPI0016536E65|nr:DOMON-like domain-containing protein [Caulobacter sp. 17J80-11]MBC6983250.1 DOMON-like domain-containing protein [Caulobacter sp. 17J80-11]